MALQRDVFNKYSVGLSLFSRLLDAVACVVAALLAYILRFGSIDTFQYRGYPILILIAVVLMLSVFPTTGLYQSWRTRPLLGPVARALAAWIIVFIVILILLVALKRSERFSREWLAMWFGLQAGLLILLRLVIFGSVYWLRRRGYNLRYVVLIGASAQAQALAQRARVSLAAGFEISAIFSVTREPFEADGTRFLPLKDLKDFLRRHTVDEVWVVLPLEQSEKLTEVLAQCDGVAANVRYVPDLRDIYLLNHGVTELLGTPMIDLRASPLQGAGFFWKTLEDRILALLILIVVSPIMAMIAVAIKLTSRGPVLYLQRRNGWDGREIVVYKFRTMQMHQEDAGYLIQALRDDKRFTRIGAFLRRTSLDEMPQFINVLQGRMSIVGPRPHAVEHNLQYQEIINRYNLRHVVRPGITGWAQVNGLRGRTETVDKMQQRVKYDLYYIENWSLWFDVKIIFLTLFKGFVNKNAY